MLRSWPITNPVSSICYISGPKPSGIDWYQIGKLVTSPDSQGVMILQGLSASNGVYINKELRFDDTEWQDLGPVQGVVQDLTINSYADHVIPVPESFTTSQCDGDYESAST